MPLDQGLDGTGSDMLLARWQGKTVRNKDERLSEAKKNGKATLLLMILDYVFLGHYLSNETV
jgi:hypothetical protein